MMLTIIESPYAGNIERNVAYARRALLDSIKRDETPFVSHLLYTQVLDDNDPGERLAGILLGHRLYGIAKRCAVYNDLGISIGMQNGIDNAIRFNVPVVYRSIGL